jgi:hypothetical protein
VALDEGGLASTTVTDQDELESRWGLRSHYGLFFAKGKYEGNGNRW